MNREYCTLQRNLKDYRAMGYDVKVKLNARAELLLAEVVRIEKLVEAAKTEVIDTEVELAEEYRMDGVEPLDYPVVTATAEELEALEVAHQAPESDWIESSASSSVLLLSRMRSFPEKDETRDLDEPAYTPNKHSEPVVDLHNADEVVANCISYRFKKYQAIQHYSKDLYRHGFHCDGYEYSSVVKFGYDVTVCGYACSLASKPKAEAELYTEAMSAEDDELTAGVVVDGCDLPEPYDYYELDSENGIFRLEDDANYLVRVWYCDLAQPYIHPELGLVNGSSLTTTTVDLSNLTDRDYGYENADTLVANITYYAGDDAGKPTFHHYDQRNPLDLLRGGLHYDNHTFGFSQVYGAACSVYPEVTSEGVLKIVPEGQPKTCSASDRPCPCGQMTIHDCAGECAEPEVQILTPDEAMWLLEDNLELSYTVTPAVKSAFKDTTAHYRVTHREPLLVAAINNTYGFLTSKLVTKTLRSAWFWSYASLCVLWAMVQLTWQGLTLAATVSYKAYKLATSPQAIALYDLVITQTLTILCNLTDYADTRWRLLWGFLDAGIELAIGLLPKRQPDLVKVQYFID